MTSATEKLTPEEREALAAHRKPYSGKKTKTGKEAQLPALSLQELDLRSDCQNHRSEASLKPRGWLKDRYQQCFADRIHMIAMDTNDGTPAGEVTFELWLLGWANNGARQADYSLSIEDITVSTTPGKYIDWPNVVLDVQVPGCIPSAEMTCASGQAKTINGWFNAPVHAMTYSSLNSTGGGDDYVSYNRFTVDVTASAPTILPGTQSDIVESRVRFDTGRKISRANGSVFPDFTPVFSLSLSDPEVDESARHIRDAQDYPERTFPSWIGKSVPGKPGGELLHRLISDADRDRNRSTSIDVCKDVWGDQYATGGRQCDEYPFATTQEGAYTGTLANGGLQRFSARPIAGSDNVTAGSRLGTFYSDQRVLDGDPFYVGINS